MKKQQITAAVIAIAILGGCTAFQSGPKYLWSASVMKKAADMNWTCVGTMRVGELINPITWFWTPPTRHYFVKQDKAMRVPGSTSDWFIEENMIDLDEGQTTCYMLYDTASNKVAYVASDSTSRSDGAKNLSNPKWAEPDKEWSRNTMRWLKDGKPLNSSYCN